ncbi:hypothetical protein P7K49_006137, partial [Saguinus oedipus]
KQHDRKEQFLLGQVFSRICIQVLILLSPFTNSAFTLLKRNNVQPNSDSEIGSSSFATAPPPRLLCKLGYENMIAVVDHNGNKLWSLQEALNCGFPDL